MILAALIAAHTSFGQQKVGHLNSSEIMPAMPEYKTMSEAIEKKKAEYSKLLEDMYKQYEKGSNDLQAMPEGPAKNLKAQEMKDLEQRITTFQQKAQSDLQNYAQDLAKPLQAKFQNAVKDVAKAQGFSYIFDLAANNVVYYPETGGFDITEAVKTKLGATLPIVKPAAGNAKAGGK
jgi:outer membrane protein